MAVQFEEMQGSPTVNFSDGQFTFQRKLMVPWSQSIDFFMELIGGYRVLGGQMSYVRPATFPGVGEAKVQTVNVEPFPPDKIITPTQALTVATNQYESALFTIEYGTKKGGKDGGGSSGDKEHPDMPSVPDGTILNYSRSLGAEILSLPGHTFVWAADNVAVDTDVFAGILQPTDEFDLNWSKVPAPNWAKIDQLSGRVNHASFMGYGPEQVLFLGLTTKREFQLAQNPFYDQPIWELAYKFKVRRVKSTVSPDTYFGWNHYYRKEPDAGGEHWLRITDTDGNPPYRPDDLTNLFTLGTYYPS